jgi:glutamate racemase
MCALSLIGVFDSGVGGLGVLRELLRLLLDERYLYLGDSARVPYGSKSPETVQLFARQCTRFLADQQVKLIVVACNCASVVALEAVQSEVDVPVIGVIELAAQSEVCATRSGQVGIIGTRFTVNSGAYSRAIQRLNAAVIVHSQPRSLFVPVVEEGWTDHSATRLIAQEYLTALFPPANGNGPHPPTVINTLVLGCTHYPLLKLLLHRLLPGVELFDCGEYAAHIAHRQLLVQNALVPARPRNGHRPAADVGFSASFVPVAERFLGFPVNGIEPVEVDHLCETVNTVITGVIGLPNGTNS